MELHENYSAVMKGFIKFAKDDVEAEKWIATDKVYTVAGWENSERMNFRRKQWLSRNLVGIADIILDTGFA